MSEQTAVYWSVDGCEARHELPHPDEELEYVAIHAAEIYHRDHDGWECQWPIIFSFYNDNNVLLGEQSVEREYEPCFSAYDLSTEQADERRPNQENSQ